MPPSRAPRRPVRGSRPAVRRGPAQASRRGGQPALPRHGADRQHLEGQPVGRRERSPAADRGGHQGVRPCVRWAGRRVARPLRRPPRHDPGTGPGAGQHVEQESARGGGPPPFPGVPRVGGKVRAECPADLPVRTGAGDDHRTPAGDGHGRHGVFNGVRRPTRLRQHPAGHRRLRGDHRTGRGAARWR